MKRRLAVFFDKYPFVETIFELLFTLSFTFMPILMAATLAESKKPTFSTTSFWNSFFSFFEKGELALIALGVCGSILFIISSKPQKITTWANFLVALVVFIILIFISGIIGDNPGFKAIRPSWLLQVLLTIYVVLNVIWMLMSLSTKKIDAGGAAGANDAVNADDIIRRADTLRRGQL